MPTAFADYEEFDEFERMMVGTGSINDRGELWYDVRPHSGHGTVEVRTPDAQADTDVVMAFVEYVHALVADLAARYEDGEEGRRHRRELLDENKWRAMRYGHDTTLLARDGAGERDLGEIVDRECSRLGVDGIREVYERESGASRQRRLRDEAGVDALCDALRL